MRSCPVIFASMLVCLLACSCDGDCDRRGCEAIEHPVTASSISAGIAGAVASLSDVVANGCQECTLSQGTMEVWFTTAAVATADEARAVVQAQPTLVIEMDERYEQMLAPGEYLVCIGGKETCAGITIADAVVSVHARYVFGPASLVVFEPGTDQPRTDRIFDLGPGV